MRYVVLIFGLLGVAGSGFFGFRWGMEWLEIHKSNEEAVQELEFVSKVKTPGSIEKIKVLKDSVEKRYGRQRALPFVLSGTILGLFATIISFSARRGLSAAILLLVIGAGPGLLDPFNLIFTGSFAVAGIFSLFVRQPRPKALQPVDL